MGSRPGTERESGTPFTPDATPASAEAHPVSPLSAHTGVVTLGVIVGNRGFFPDHLCEKGRKVILDVLERQGIRVVITPAESTNNGAISDNAEARLCADHFKQHADEIDGVLITLPNFGEERPIANTLRWANLNVPVLVHAFEDDADKMTIVNRRDSFCGKMSCCNNLRQYGIKFTLTTKHTMDPESEAFAADLRSLQPLAAWFVPSRTSASGRSARGRPRSIRCAIARNCSSAAVSRSRRWTSRRSLAGSGAWATTRRP